MKERVFVMLVLIMLAGWNLLGFAQPAGDIRELKLRDWQPRSMLKARQSSVEKPAYPVIDVHNHMDRGKNRLTTERVKHYLAEMDAAGVRTVGSKSDGLESRSIRSIRSAQTLAKSRRGENKMADQLLSRRLR